MGDFKSRQRVLSFKINVDSKGITDSRSAIVKQVKTLVTDINNMLGTVQKSLNEAFNPAKAILRINGLAKVVDQRTASMAKSFDNVAQSANRAKASIDAIGTSANASKTGMASLSTAATKASTAISKVAAASDKAKASSMEATFAANAQANMLDKLEQQAKQTGTAIVGMNAASRGSAAAAGAMGAGVAAGGAAMRTGILASRDLASELVMLRSQFQQIAFAPFATAAFWTVFFAAPTKAFADFEKEVLTLSGLVKAQLTLSAEQSKEPIKELALVSGKAQQAVTGLTQEFRTLAIANGFLAKEVAVSGIELARMGVELKDVGSAMRIVSDLAIANSITMDDASKIVVGTTQAMGLSMTEMTRVSNVLTRVAVDSSADMKTLGVSMRYAAPVAQSYGQSIEELGAFLDLLSKKSINASIAGTTFRSMMTNLAKQTPEAKDALYKLGVTVTDSAGRIRPILDITKDLALATADLTNKQKNQAIATIFGKTSLSGALAAINSTTDAVEKARKTMESAAISTKALSDEMRQGVTFEFNQMRSAVNQAAIDIGRSFAPAAKGAMDTVTGLSKAISGLDSGTRDMAASALATVAKWTTVGVTLFAVAGIAKMGLGAFTKLGGYLLELGGTILVGLTTRLSALRTALAITIGTFGAARAGAITWGTAMATAGGALSALVGPLTLATALVLGLAAAFKHAANQQTILNNEMDINQSKIDQQTLKQKTLKVSQTAEQKAKSYQSSSVASAEGISAQELSAWEQRERRKGNAGATMLADQLKAAREAKSGGYSKALEDRDKAMSTVASFEKNPEMKAQYQKTLDAANAKLKQQYEAMKVFGAQTAEEERLYNLSNQQHANQLEQEKEASDRAKATSDKLDKERNKAIAAEAERLRNAADKIRDDARIAARNEITQKQLALASQGAAASMDELSAQIGKGIQSFHTIGKYSSTVEKEWPNLVRDGVACAATFTTIGNSLPQFKNFRSVMEKTTGSITYVPTMINTLLKKGLIEKIDNAAAKAGDIVTAGDLGHIGWVGQGSKGQRTIVQTEGGPWAGTKAKLITRDYSTLDPTMHSGRRGQNVYRFTQAGLKQFGATAGVDEQAIQKKHNEQAQAKLGALANTAKFKENQDMILAIRRDMIAEGAKYDQQAAEQLMQERLQLEKQANEEILRIQKDTRSIKASAEMAQAEIDKKTFQVKIDQMKAAHKQEADDMAAKYSSSVQFASLQSELLKKHAAEMSAYSKQEEAEIRKRIEALDEEMAKGGLNEHAKASYDLTKQIAIEEAKYLKMLGEASLFTANQVAQQSRLVGLLKERKDIQDQAAVITGIEERNVREIADAEQVLADLALQKEKGQISSASYAEYEVRLVKQKMAANEKVIAAMEAMNPIAARLLGYDKQIAAKKREQVQFQGDLNKKASETPTAKLAILEAQRSAGMITQSQYLQGQLDQYNRIVEEAKKANGYDLLSKGLIKERASLMGKVAIANGDILGAIKAQVLSSAEAVDLNQVNFELWEGASINAGQLFESIERSIPALGKMASELFGISDDAAKLAGSMANLGVAIVSGNPAAIIGGVIDTVASLGAAIKENFLPEDEIKKRTALFKAELADLDAKIIETRANISVARGDLTASEARAVTGKSSREAGVKRVDALKAERQQYANQNAAALASPFLSDAAKAKIVQDIEKMNREIEQATLESEKSIVDERNAMNSDNAQQQALLVDKRLALEEYAASQTISAIDDVKVARDKEWEETVRRQKDEMDAAIQSGQNTNALAQIHSQELANINKKYRKQEESAKAKDRARELEADFSAREHKIFMMEDTVQKSLESINLERDKKKAALETEKADVNKTAEEIAIIDNKLAYNEIERRKEVQDAWAAYTKEIVKMSRNASLELAATMAAATSDERDDIEAERQSQLAAEQERLQSRLEAVKGNGEAENKIRDQYLQEFARRSLNIEQATNVKIMQLYADRAKKIRDIAVMEAQNTGDVAKGLIAEHQAQKEELADWYEMQKFMHQGNTEALLQLDREYAAKKKALDRDTNKKIIDYVNEYANRVKTLRQEQFELDSREHELAIRREEERLKRLEREREKLQKQIDEYDRKIADMLDRFDEVDKTQFMDLLRGTDVTPELRAGLEAISNPENLSNDVASLQSWREGMKEQIELLKIEAQNKRDLEEISEESYQKELSRINLIQAKFAQQVLDDSRFNLKRRERAEITKEMADAYVAYQQAEQEVIKHKFDAEKKAVNESIKVNEEQQRGVKENIEGHQDAIEDLRWRYEDDVRAIDEQVHKVEAAHRGWSVTLEQVRNNYSAMVSEIPSKVSEIASKMNEAISSIRPWPTMPNYNLNTGGSAPAVSSNLTGTASSNYSAPPTTTSGGQIYNTTSSQKSPDGKVITTTGANGAKNTIYREPQQTGIFVYNPGDGWFYQSTSDYMAVKAAGFADGGLTPMGGPPGDIYPAMLSKREAVIPLDKMGSVVKNIGGTTYVVNIDRPTVRNDSDIRAVATEVYKGLQRVDASKNFAYAGNLI